MYECSKIWINVPNSYGIDDVNIGIVELFETLTREDESLSNDSLLESVSQYDDPDAYVGGNAIPTAVIFFI